MTRREIREEIFKMLFRADFHDKETIKEQETLFFERLQEAGKESKDLCYMKEKVDSLLEHLEEIDHMLNDVAKGWKTTRMGKVDLTLLRLAVYEIRYEEGMPTGVAINEAVELAKKYGTDESSSFVNGVLAKIT
jgi:transcription antitermination factor NusB